MQAAKNWCDGERVKKLGIWDASKQGLRQSDVYKAVGQFNALVTLCTGFLKPCACSVELLWSLSQMLSLLVLVTEFSMAFARWRLPIKSAAVLCRRFQWSNRVAPVFHTQRRSLTEQTRELVHIIELYTQIISKLLFNQPILSSKHL